MQSSDVLDCGSATYHFLSRVPKARWFKTSFVATYACFPPPCQWFFSIFFKKTDVVLLFILPWQTNSTPVYAPKSYHVTFGFSSICVKFLEAMIYARSVSDWQLTLKSLTSDEAQTLMINQHLFRRQKATSFNTMFVLVKRWYNSAMRACFRQDAF